MLFYKEIRENIVSLGSENILSIKEIYLNHQKIKKLNKTQLDEYQKMIGEEYSKEINSFYSIVQDFWSQLDKNTEEYSKDMKDIFSQSIREFSDDLEKNIKSNFANPFKFFENISNSFVKSNASYLKISDKNFENFKLLIEKINNLIKEFTINCEQILSSFEVKDENP